MVPDLSAEWKGIWSKVAEELGRYRADGLSHLVTEDVLRFATIQALARSNVDPASLRIEYPHPVIRGGKIDLAIGFPPGDVIEFKYPREPNEKNAAWTMVLGEVLKDFYRLAVIKGQVRRQVVLVATARLRRFLESSAQRHRLILSPERVELVPEVIAALPATAIRILSDLQAHHVKAAGTTYIIDDNLRLISYLVSPIAE
jgi:hypothetical protein